ADRKHPRKKKRPFAAGDISPLAGVGAIVLMLTASGLLAAYLRPLTSSIVHAIDPGATVPHAAVAGGLPFGFLGWLALYTVTTLAYSFYLKRRLLLDVFVLSGLYTLRILAGSAAADVGVSAWLAGFSVFFFLSLAFIKRFSELEGLRERGGTVSNGRGYFVSDLEQLRALGVGAMYAAVVVLTLYINNPDNAGLYHHMARLWLVVPVMLLWLSRMWMLASRGAMHDDPVVFAITDKRSLALGVLMAMIVWWAL
ncbi:MAG: prenyltransferase, partial [Bryocella sp.]